MKTKRQITQRMMLAALCTAAIFESKAGGSAQEQTLYSHSEAGVSLVRPIGFAGGFSARLDPGFRLSLVEGVHVNKWLDVETDTGFIYNSFADLDGELWQVPITLNLVAQYPKRTGLVPYIGGGVGADFGILSLNHVGPWRVDVWEPTIAFAYQGLAGLRYQIDKDVAISLDYKFLCTHEPSWGDGNIKFGAVRSHSICLGLTFGF